MKPENSIHKWNKSWINRLLATCREWLTFGQEIIKNPIYIGAVCPSSKYLGRSIAKYVPKLTDDNEYLVELGAGTGGITKQLIKAGIPANKLILIERSAKLANLLSKRFPDCQVIHGDAANLLELLGEHQQYVNTVVSGLPLVSLPKIMVSKIINQIESLPSNQVRLIQFTYRIVKHSSNIPANQLHRVNSQHVWLNIPPARLDVYQQTTS